MKYIVSLIIVLFVFVLFAEKRFRVPNGFGKVELQEIQKEAIKIAYEKVYTPEVLKIIAEFEQKKAVWRHEYLTTAWNILTEEQKKIMPEKFRIQN